MPRSTHRLARLRGAHLVPRLQSLGLVATLVFALVGAPALGAIRNECNLCPSTCPMHQERQAARDSDAPRMKCHSAKPHGGEEQPPPRAADHGSSIARATCGNHGIMPATALPPMLLPAARPHLIVPVADSAPAPRASRAGRSADPPDTPPPIRAA